MFGCFIFMNDKSKNNQLDVLIVLKFPTSIQLSCQVQSILLTVILTYKVLANAKDALVCPHYGSHPTSSIKKVQSSSAVVHG
jgi:hypothetical protein